MGEAGNPAQAFIGRQSWLRDRVAREFSVSITVVGKAENDLLQIVFTLRTRSSLPYSSDSRQGKDDDYGNESNHYCNEDPNTHLDLLSLPFFKHNSTTHNRCQHVRIGDVGAFGIGQDVARQHDEIGQFAHFQ